MSEHKVEQQVLMVMRKLLGNIVKETTPPPGMRHPLSDNTIEDIKMAFSLIASRERELADRANIAPERPYYTDQEPSAKVVSMNSIGKAKVKD